MKTKIIFLRHADVEKDPSVNASKWCLSEKGIKQATEISKLPVMNDVDVIYASSEDKTNLTVKPLADKLKKDIVSMSEFDEVRRGDKFLSDEEFKKGKRKQLEDLSYHAFDGESGEEALKRFKNGIDEISEENKNKTILIVTHGTVLSIYFADLLGVYNELSERWKKTGFCACGIIEGEKVKKDII